MVATQPNGEVARNEGTAIMAYVVYYTGEYDMDDFGNVFTAYNVFDDYDRACYEANYHTNTTGYIATVEEI